ncbi:TPA: hypothetical protein MNM85_004530 [Citrobacter freundii]|nr:hypothetical protein [Citrobacter freundii]HBZ9022451.1 hypothetical protein [Citrobacter freundii]HCA0566163.1 hypothetical protein [Citrobacter freundii]HCA0664146.1 hypothetical protein [Citrobacter freundii]HCA0670064.1 hypothetical protein [Citrobacter freundii]
MTDMDIEKEIVAKGKTAARVTPAHDLMSAANTQLISHFSACAEDFHNR